jgi:hypothetical protein
VLLNFEPEARRVTGSGFPEKATVELCTDRDRERRTVMMSDLALGSNEGLVLRPVAE